MNFVVPSCSPNTHSQPAFPSESDRRVTQHCHLPSSHFLSRCDSSLALIACPPPVASLVASTRAAVNHWLAWGKPRQSSLIITLFLVVLTVRGVNRTHAVHHKVVTPSCHVGVLNKRKGSLQQWHVVYLPNWTRSTNRAWVTLNRSDPRLYLPLPGNNDSILTKITV